LVAILVLGALSFPAVAQATPVACFTESPAAPYFTGTTITFNSSCSTGASNGRYWDLDNTNEFNDGTGVTVSRTYSTPGTYTVKLAVLDNQDDYDIKTKQITVSNRPPVSSFTYSPSAPKSGDAITFTSTSTDPDGTIASQSWDFDGDGFDDGTTPTVTKSFPTPGTITARLRVVDNRGAEHTSTQTVTIANRPPVSSFTYSPAAPKAAEPVTFTSHSTDPDGTISSYAWEFDGTNDFNDGTSASVSKTFATAGDYTVKLRVTDNNGGQHTSSQTVKVVANKPPAASFSYLPASPLSGQSVTFTSTSNDPDGTIASQAWELDNTNDFNDGTGTTVSRTFSKSGPVTIKLRVRDNSGGEDIDTQTVTIGNRAPVAGFDVAPLQPISKQLVTFTSVSTDPDGTIASQAWEFDGTNDFNDGTGPVATRTYSAPGTYTVKLRVRDNGGAEKIASREVTVANRPPTGSFAYKPSAPVAGDAVALTATTADEDGTIAKQAWDLDNDGQFDDATGSTASFTPAAAGSYPVGLKVTDNSGDSVIATDTVVVGERALPRPVQPPAAGESGGGGAFDTTGPDVTVPVAPVLRWLDPFPVVRIRGLATRQGAKLTLLSVTAPAGVTATLSCAGHGCPVKRLTAKVKAAKGKGVGVVRFRKMERVLPAGTRLEVAVTADGLVGKYTRFTIRRLALPGRTDRCIMPGAPRPASCPSTP
jgi:PKD repeat protein